MNPTNRENVVVYEDECPSSEFIQEPYSESYYSFSDGTSGVIEATDECLENTLKELQSAAARYFVARQLVNEKKDRQYKERWSGALELFNSFRNAEEDTLSDRFLEDCFPTERIRDFWLDIYDNMKKA